MDLVVVERCSFWKQLKISIKGMYSKTPETYQGIQHTLKREISGMWFTICHSFFSPLGYLLIPGLQMGLSKKMKVFGKDHRSDAQKPTGHLVEPEKWAMWEKKRLENKASHVASFFLLKTLAKILDFRRLWSLSRRPLQNRTQTWLILEYKGSEDGSPGHTKC